jgi:ATP-dependent Lon protease
MNLRRNKRVRYNETESDDSEFDEDYKFHNKTTDLENLKNTNKSAYDNFLITKREISESEPKIITILTEPLLNTDRAKLLQIYEIYKFTTPSTQEWLNTRNNVIKLFNEYKNNYKQHCKYTNKQHKEMNKQISLLENYNPNTDLKYQILQLDTSIKNKQTIYSRYTELQNMSLDDDEKTKLRHWLTWAVSIPHDTIKTFPFSKNQLTDFLRYVSQTLDTELYGMKRVKESILLFVSSKIQNPHIKRCSLGLIGKPGVGKTAISRLLSQILNFPFEQISLGGISNPDYLKGHEYTYVGAQPGEIVKCMKRMKYKNGILFLDEFDKISDNKDICSSLLHITDPVQNSEFRDKFLSDITIDLSYLWFIYSMNELPSDSALRDRIYTIEVPGYELQDKICIIIDYLFPKSLKNINTPINSIIISKSTAEYIIKTKHNWESDTGVRTLEKDVNNIVTKIDFLIKHQDKKGKLKGFNISFDMSKLIKYPIKLTTKMIDILI